MQDDRRSFSFSVHSLGKFLFLNDWFLILGVVDDGGLLLRISYDGRRFLLWHQELACIDGHAAEELLAAGPPRGVSRSTEWFRTHGALRRQISFLVGSHGEPRFLGFNSCCTSWILIFVFVQQIELGVQRLQFSHHVVTTTVSIAASLGHGAVLAPVG